MKKHALLSYSRAHFDPTQEEQKLYSASVIAKSLYDSLIHAEYEVEYIDPQESPKHPGFYDLFIGQPLRWTEIAKACQAKTNILFMPTGHPLYRNERMRVARNKWKVPRDEELLDESSSALYAFEFADYIFQIGNEPSLNALITNGVPRHKIVPIHYGLPVEWAASAPRASGPPDAYVHTASELGLRKGLPPIVQAFSTPPFNNKQLTLVGEIQKNENHVYWHAQIEKLRQKNNQVAYLGFINSASDKYKKTLAAHAWYLFPSVEDVETGTIQEAMSVGLVPLLASRESGIDFAMDDDFKASFEDLLAKTLSVSKEYWQILSTKARRYIELFHNHAMWEERLVELFCSIHAGEKDLRPTASIILTVHNKEKYIVRLLKTLLENSRSYPKWDLHIVYDGCNDASRAMAQEVLKSFPVPVYEYETPDVWEVKANNYGLRKARGKYCVILQDDNFIYENTWLEKMLGWLQEHPRVGVLGGLAGVNFFHLDSDPQGAGVNRSTFELHQRLDPTVEKQLNEYIFEADAVMRGPIILRKELLEKHGYLDEAYAPLYNDDMDYCFRMRSLGYGVFCYPINVVNENLTMAKYSDSAKNAFWQDTGEKNQKLFYSRWRDDIEKHHAFHLKVPKSKYADTALIVRPRWGQGVKRRLLAIQKYEVRKKIRSTMRTLFLRVPAPLVRTALRVLKKMGTPGQTASKKLYIHYFEGKTIPWRLAQGETTLRINYPLDDSSLIYYLGVPDEKWVKAIRSRYGCEVRTPKTFKPTDIPIDLVSMHMKGGEYDLLEHLIETGFIKQIRNIQVKFDDSLPNARERMYGIRRKLRETHTPTYQYEFVWENWERKN